MALDFPSLEPALEMAQSLAGHAGLFKINIQLFTAAGPAAVEQLGQFGPGVFLDLKFHDIPNTVKGATAAAMALPGVQLLNVHALGGSEMMRAAAEVASSRGLPSRQRPAILGVTILTSMDSAALREAGISGPAAGRVLKLAKLAKASGLDGVVASPHEVRAIRRACGKDFLIVVPGIRPEFAPGKTDDQARVATPAAAIRAGADYLVVGRPITAAPDPAAAARAIIEEISSASPRS